jgi:hypothetical protein
MVVLWRRGFWSRFLNICVRFVFSSFGTIYEKLDGGG